MLAVASLKRSLEFDPVEQGAKRKRAEMKLSPPSSPIAASSSTYSINANPTSPSKQQTSSIFVSSPKKKNSLVVQKPCSLTVNDDVPMFSYAQTAQMCARLLREQDRKIREQYDELLTKKLTEQYDTFIRFTHDSVHKDSSNRLFPYVPKQEQNNNATSAFSYVS